MDVELLNWFKENIQEPLDRIDTRVEAIRRDVNGHLKDHKLDKDRAIAELQARQERRDKTMTFVKWVAGLIATVVTAAMAYISAS